LERRASYNIKTPVCSGSTNSLPEKVKSNEIMQIAFGFKAPFLEGSKQ